MPLALLLFGGLRIWGIRAAKRSAAVAVAIVMLGTSLGMWYADYDYNPSSAICPPRWVCTVVSLAFTVPFAIFMWKVLANAGNTMDRASE